MITITLEMNDADIRLNVKGHARHDVCGKVSILCQALTESLFFVRSEGNGYYVKNEDGFCSILFRIADLDQEYRTKVLSMFSFADTGFRLIMEQFPDEIKLFAR